MVESLSTAWKQSVIKVVYVYLYIPWKSHDSKIFVQSLHSVWMQWSDVLPACQPMCLHFQPIMRVWGVAYVL